MATAPSPQPGAGTRAQILGLIHPAGAPVVDDTPPQVLVQFGPPSEPQPGVAEPVHLQLARAAVAAERIFWTHPLNSVAERQALVAKVRLARLAGAAAKRALYDFEIDAYIEAGILTSVRGFSNPADWRDR